MIILCLTVIVGVWLEHLLLLGPALNPSVSSIPLSISDGLITLGFLGLMIIAVTYFLRQFPELVRTKKREVR